MLGPTRLKRTPLASRQRLDPRTERVARCGQTMTVPGTSQLLEPKPASWVGEVVAWATPLMWTIPWGLFRGEYAHGGHVWWRHVHLGGLLVLVTLALILRRFLWRRLHGTGKRSRRIHLTGQAALLALATIASWLSFQTGLALHIRPASLNEFLWGEP